VIFLCSALAVILSFFHLGSPFHAVFSLRNLSTSWLSREILLLLFFLGLTAVCALLTFQKKRSSLILQIPVWGGGLAGLLLIGAMSAVYMLPTVPVWKSFLTPASYLLTSFLLGTQLTAAGLTLLLGSDSNSKAESLRLFWHQNTLMRLETLSIVFASLSLLVTLVFFLQNGPSGFHSFSWGLSIRKDLPFLVARILFSVLGVILLIKELLRLRRDKEGGALRPFFIYAGFIVLLLAEICGRYLFFALYQRSGI
jgi:anaerobic dimethyl sulfoxide reductase subunit C (anchor subunit)